MDETFEIIELIGHGGMGSVYKAKDLRNGRIVALKLIHPHLSDQPEFRRRFLNEIEVALAIEHPNVIPVYDVGLSDESPYIAMKLVSGLSLHAHLHEQGAMPADQAVEIVSQIASALDFAHAKGIIHRDVKPANILLDETAGHAYLTDFGVAKALESQTDLTRTGTVIGALRYMAPEQFDDREIDTRVDVYALGCVLFEMLAGQLPFRAQTDASLIREKLMAQPVSLTELAPTADPRLEPVLRKALSRDPHSRHPTCLALAEVAKEALGQGETSVATTAATVPVALPASGGSEEATTVLANLTPHHSYRKAILAFSVAAALLAGVGYWLLTVEGDGDASNSEANNLTSTQVASASFNRDTASPSSLPKLENVSAAYFEAMVPRGWQQVATDEEIANRLSNRWVSSDNPNVSILIDAQVRTNNLSPEQSMRGVRRHTSKSAGYEEVSISRVKIGQQDAAEWVFYIPGEGKKVDYFFSQCNIDFALLGTAPKNLFERYLSTFTEVAESVEANCQALETSSPITTEGIGPILVGMSVEQAERAGNTSLYETTMSIGNCVYYESTDVDGISFMFVDGVLERVDASTPDARSLSGIRIGDPATKVRRVYGDNIKESPNHYDPERSAYLTYVPDDPDDITRVLFDTTDDQVVHIRSGRLPAISWVEGCA